MTDPLSAYIHRSWLVDGDGAQSENVNKVAIYYWDTIGLSWTKATGGAIPGANVNVTNFPANYTVLQGTIPWSDNISQYGGVATSLGQKAMASSIPITLASDQSTVSTAGGTTLTTDKTLLTKTILTGAAVDGSGFVNVGTTTDGGIVINQNIAVDALSSTTTNLAGGATFTGPAIPDLNYTAVQYAIKSDQNCTVYVEQSPDAINWDISDAFSFNAPTGSGNTVQLVASYYRIRVTNTSTVASTYLRLQVIKVPFLPSLPRSLDADGHLSTHVYGSQDFRGIEHYNAPNGEFVSVPLYKLCGDSFGGDIIDPSMWTTTLGTGGTAVTTTGQLELSTGTTANNSTSVVSITTARFSGLAPNKVRIPLSIPDGGTVNNIRIWGMRTANDGAYFKLSGTTLDLITFLNGAETVRATNGAFNGQFGLTFNIGTSSHFYEVIWQPRQVVWLADNKIIHTFNAAVAPWSGTLHFPIYLENTNINGSTTNVVLQVRLAAAARFGIPQMEKKATFVSGITAATIIKHDIGNFHDITISAIANNARIIFYDNIAASGKVLFDTGPMPANTTPISLSMGGAHYNIGLTVVISGASANVLAIWD
jgi:hypothetical protein